MEGKKKKKTGYDILGCICKHGNEYECARNCITHRRQRPSRPPNVQHRCLNPEQEMDMAICQWVEVNESPTAEIEALEARSSGWVLIWYCREEGRMNTVISDLAAATSEAEVARISQAAFDWDQSESAWPLTRDAVADAWKRFPQHALELALLPPAPLKEDAKVDPATLRAIGLAIYSPSAPEEQNRKRRRREDLFPLFEFDE